MKKSDIYNGFSGINEKYRTESENFDDIAAEFRRAGIRRAEKIISFAASLVIAVIAGVNIHDKNNIADRSLMIAPSFTDESSPVISETAVSTEKEQNTVTSNAVTETASNKNTEETDTSISETAKSGHSPDKIPAFTQTEITMTARQTKSVIHENDKFNGSSTSKTSHTTTKNHVFTTDSTISEKPAVTIGHTTVTATVLTSVHTTEKPYNTTVTPPPEIMEEPSYRPSVTTRPSESAADKNPGTRHTTTAATTLNPGLSRDECDEYANSFCFFDNGYYKTVNRTVDVNFIDEYLGVTDIYRYDESTGTSYQRKARVYKIRDISKYEMIAVNFDYDARFFAYSQS